MEGLLALVGFLGLFLIAVTEPEGNDIETNY